MVINIIRRLNNNLSIITQILILYFPGFEDFEHCPLDTTNCSSWMCKHGILYIIIPNFK